MSKANKGTKKPKARWKNRPMDRGELRAAKAKGHAFWPLLYCPRCQGRSHDPSHARKLAAS